MKKEKKVKDNSERWMLSYLDFITLLMIFFIVMYAISNVDNEKYKALSTSLKTGFLSGGEDIIGTQNNIDTSPNIDSDYSETSTSEDSSAQSLENLKEKIDNLIANSDLKDNATTKLQEKGLTISFNSILLFNSGDAAIKDNCTKNLLSISKILNECDNYIRIEGHTDNVSIKNDTFSSNWQLSSIRAANVAEFLTSNGNVNPKRLSSIGYGEYRPIESNDTESGRSANRRVDILILDSKFNPSEDINK